MEEAPCALHPPSIDPLGVLSANPSSVLPSLQLCLAANRNHCKGRRCSGTLLRTFYVAMPEALLYKLSHGDFFLQSVTV